MTRNSLSGNLAAKSSAAFSTAAGSVLALAALNASNSGWVLACGGWLGGVFWAGAWGFAGVFLCRAGGFFVCVAPACAHVKEATARIAPVVASGFLMYSFPCILS